MMRLGYPLPYTSIYYHITVDIAFLNCCVNPFIYTLKLKQFRDAARELLRCCKAWWLSEFETSVADQNV